MYAVPMDACIRVCVCVMPLMRGRSVCVRASPYRKTQNIEPGRKAAHFGCSPANNSFWKTTFALMIRSCSQRLTLGATDSGRPFISGRDEAALAAATTMCKGWRAYIVEEIAYLR
eukprot:GHVU01185621.1.p2 GENE.GHVU01185621.1~~GHVU01185621.1.p2  ORF type:complete len:115 (+),score=2.22 GHVU01185621.1:241-585(+)